jgi:hypothetical protein
MKSAGDTGMITSVTASNIGNDFERSKECCNKKCLAHAKGSCHYGCKVSGEEGLSHAFDYDIRGNETDAELCSIADKVHTCNGGVILGPKTVNCPGGGNIKAYKDHTGHLHISTAACNG